MTRESVADRPDGRPAIYDPKRIEEKWQKRWAERGTNTWTDAALRGASRPFFNLMMFPYPSAEGLHVGNMYAFTGADVYGRWRKLSGDDVFEPIGFDAFGIHSENFALKMGVNPMDLIPRNIRNFTRGGPAREGSGTGQLVPFLPYGPRQRAGGRWRMRAMRDDGDAALAVAMVLSDHALCRPAAGQSLLDRLVGVDEESAGELDRQERGRRDPLRGDDGRGWSAAGR